MLFVGGKCHQQNVRAYERLRNALSSAGRIVQPYLS